MVEPSQLFPIDINPADLSNISPEIASGIADVIFIIKAIGVIVLIYIIFLIISSIMNIIRSIRIKRIYEKVNEIDAKLDLLLKSDKSKSELLKRLAEKGKLTEKTSEKSAEKKAKKSFFSFLFNREKKENNKRKKK